MNEARHIVSKKGKYACKQVYHDNYSMLHTYVQWFEWDGAMGHSPIPLKNDPLPTEIAILNQERMVHWNINCIG